MNTFHNSLFPYPNNGETRMYFFLCLHKSAYSSKRSNQMAFRKRSQNKLFLKLNLNLINFLQRYVNFLIYLTSKSSLFLHTFPVLINFHFSDLLNVLLKYSFITMQFLWRYKTLMNICIFMSLLLLCVPINQQMKH